MIEKKSIKQNRYTARKKHINAETIFFEYYKYMSYGNVVYLLCAESWSVIVNDNELLNSALESVIDVSIYLITGSTV